MGTRTGFQEMQEMQGALTRPGERRTERAGAKRQTFHGYRARDKRATDDPEQEMQEMQERPCGAIGEAVVQSGVSRKGQASKPLNFQTSGARQRPTQSANQLIS